MRVCIAAPHSQRCIVGSNSLMLIASLSDYWWAQEGMVGSHVQYRLLLRQLKKGLALFPVLYPLARTCAFDSIALLLFSPTT